ncbi:MAG: peptide ABC transporter substrate-binding protein [Lentisphaeria bacterium]|nr:peptide ABC transporter substrate-binding protein [Lentisphaeria bacterium]
MRIKGTFYPLFFLAMITARAELPVWKQAFVPDNDQWRKTPQKLIFNSGADPETLDPHQVTAMDSFRLVEALFEGLVTADPETLETRPGTAAEWTVSDDGRTYTFTLFKNARWSDGQALTAADFVQSFKRALSPDTAASYAELYFHIVGARAYYKRENPEFSSVGVRALTPTTLQVTLENPCSYFLELLAMPVFFPVRLDLIDRHEDQWTQPGNLVGNGAFQLSAWAPRDRIVLTKNRRYHDAEFVKLERIDALFVDDLNTAYKLYLEGQVDWLPSIPHPRVEEIKRHPDYYIVPFAGTYFYRFNVTKAPFDNPLVRRAFCRATDRKAITGQLLKSGQLPVASFCPEIGGYTPVDGLAYDPLKARELLSEAGFGTGKKPFPVIELSYNTDEGHKQIAEAVAHQWKRVLGVSVVTANTEWKVFLEDMKELNYQICRSSWIGDYGDPSTFFDIFEGSSGNNRTGWSHPRYDALLNKTRTEQSQARRLAMFQEMERILVEEECPVLPIYRYVNVGLLAEYVFGWYPNVRNAHPFKYMWIER